MFRIPAFDPVSFAVMGFGIVLAAALSFISRVLLEQPRGHFHLLQKAALRARAVADDLPSERSTNLAKRNRFDVPKHDNVLRVKRDDKVITVAPKRHQPSRTLDVGGQPNLKRIIGAVASLGADRDDWPTPRRP